MKRSTNMPVHFIYDQDSRYSGSTVMRGEQLSEIAKKVLPRNDVFFTPSNQELSGSILFLTKGSIRFYGPDGLAMLKQSGNTLIFDPVDLPLTEDVALHADIIVAASEKALQQYQKSFPALHCVLVDHHVDPRISDIKMNPLTNFKIGYFGELFNTYATKAIKQKVDFIRVDTTRQENSWLEKLPNYNMHYAIRVRANPNRHKPFLKGFIAAHCNSNIIAQESETDVLRWLGDDYPYLFRGEVTGDKVLQAIEYAKESFGSKEWQMGLERMKEIKGQTSETAIGRQLLTVIESV